MESARTSKTGSWIVVCIILLNFCADLAFERCYYIPDNHAKQSKHETVLVIMKGDDHFIGGKSL